MTSVAEQIRLMINSGELRPGQRLVEKDLSDIFGVSKVPVREALRTLAGDGLVELVPHSSARVRRISPREIIGLQKVLLALFKVAIDDLLECEDRAATISLLEKRVACINQARHNKDTLAIIRELHAFQTEMTMGSHNNFLIDTLKRARYSVYHSHLTATVGTIEWVNASSKYDELVARLANSDAKGAKKIIDWKYQQVLRALANKTG
ncbi:DNA-binding transcriptional regulator, GntR family [Sphingobium faniae]|nr:DNA-binding transcriptional regulator, GntR family [Sphingobium faniae]